MKEFRFLIVVFAVAVLINGCQKDDQFTISGKITNAEGQTIYMEELLINSTNIIDSVEINKNGEFEFKQQTSAPTFYLLKLSPEKLITLLIDSAEQVRVEADFVNFTYEYNVEGSLGSKLVKDLTMKLNETRHKLDSLNSINTMYQGNPEYEKLNEQWDEQYNNIVQEQVDFSTKFVNDNPFSMASILALYQKFDPRIFVINDIQTMRVAASALNSIYPESEHVKALYANTLQLIKEEKSAELQQFIEENGLNSPEIVLPDANGNEIALSSLQGKVVLLQFWAAVNRDSRIINPVLVEAYNKYKNKGFEIYQVSIDDNRIEWVDAIDQDKLTWINVGDMEGSVSALQRYNVQSIPYNYLLDKEGNVIGQNLKGPQLDKALASVFK